MIIIRKVEIMKITLVGFNARYIHSCLALFHVRNELERQCPNTQLNFLQLTINDSSYEILLRITATRPDYVFFSAAIWNSDLVERSIRDLSICMPDCGFVVGGPQAPVIASNLGEGLCTVVTGPIEAVDPAFYRDLEKRKLRLRYTTTLPAKKYEFLSPYQNPDFSSHLANRHVYYESSRGCPFSCTYCLSATQKGILYKDLSIVEAELEQILGHRPKVIRFVDRTFNDRPERALAIWRFLVRQQSGTLFHFEISPTGFTEEMFDFLSRVPQGLFRFEIGIQSTNTETLKAVRRPMDISRASENVARLASFLNIFLHVDLILGLPFETAPSFYRSFTQVFSMSAHYIQMGLLKILPDTPICHTAQEYGYRFCRQPPYSILANRWLAHEELSQLYWFCECVERFVNTRYFLSLWAYLRRREEDIAEFFSHLLSICRIHFFFDRAPTQELLSTLLLEAVSNRTDRRLIFDLVCYDWLRCGHRFVPDCLSSDGEESAAAMKKRLFQLLPESLDGVYPGGGKKHFCKQALFRRFSKAAMVELGYPDQRDDGWLCFLPEKDTDLYGLSRVVRLKLD